jgi:lipid-A-disaccharide synthase-like uncharacterized protein
MFDPWLAVGFGAQGLFSTRFLLQWIHSERLRRSAIPKAFWYISLVGGTLLLAYAVHKRDPVFIVGQASGILVYVRNLMLWKDAPRGE